MFEPPYTANRRCRSFRRSRGWGANRKDLTKNKPATTPPDEAAAIYADAALAFGPNGTRLLAEAIGAGLALENRLGGTIGHAGAAKNTANTVREGARSGPSPLQTASSALACFYVAPMAGIPAAVDTRDLEPYYNL
jgi:hypothetical protein